MGRHPHTPVKRWLVDIVLLGQSWSAFYHPPQRNSYGSNALSAASRPASKACYQHANHGQLDERFAGLHLPLVVFAHSAAPRDPRKRAFEDPALRPIGRFVSVMVFALSRSPTEGAVSAEKER